MGKNKHETLTIYNWKRYGLILREDESYQDIYSFVMNIENCNLCNVKFNNENHSQKRCMDHDHKTGYFRQVLCMSCNKLYDTKKDKKINKSKTGFRWIAPTITKNKSGNICVSFRYERAGFRRKASQSLTKLIALSFIHLLQKPI